MPFFRLRNQYGVSLQALEALKVSCRCLMPPCPSNASRQAKLRGKIRNMNQRGVLFLKKREKKNSTICASSKCCHSSFALRETQQRDVILVTSRCRCQPVLYETSASPTNNLACSILACRGGKGLILSCQC